MHAKLCYFFESEMPNCTDEKVCFKSMGVGDESTKGKLTCFFKYMKYSDN